jgi:DNA-binding response OmpR family regulator
MVIWARSATAPGRDNEVDSAVEAGEAGGLACRAVPRVLLATDADWIHQEVDAALAGDDIEVLRVSRGTEVRPAVQASQFDLVVLDLQIGNMGGMATCMDLRLDESVDRLDHVPVLMLLDRDVDAFLASRCEADGWVVKPLDPFSLRRAATSLLAGEEWKPVPQAATHVDDLDEEFTEFEETAEETRLGDTTVEGTTAEATATGDQVSDPEQVPGTEVAAERASEEQGA